MASDLWAGGALATFCNHLEVVKKIDKNSHPRQKAKAEI
jgi:hypothetical protein